ncbi:hypothetical protein RR42_m1080 [Cupriavidus basilensis]|uniref:Uncharacterized protein n=1 Tax=Cupriavidus basilensis TaxID=68895 RepID=A0A0C4Y0N9_9BURK|nr:hypothetical protein RR42_m1080 [Cupriavidus basilensis]
MVFTGMSEAHRGCFPGESGCGERMASCSTPVLAHIVSESSP